MDEVEVEAFYDNGVAMVRYPDGSTYRLADVMRSAYPDMDFDDATGAMMAARPPRADDPTPATPREEYSFGDTGNRTLRRTIDDVSAVAGAGGEITRSMLPEDWQQTFPDAMLAAGDYGLAGLMGLLGGVETAAGYAGDVAEGVQNVTGLGGRYAPGGSARALQADLMGMFDAAGAAPEGRLIAAIDAARPTGTARGLLTELGTNEYGGLKLFRGDTGSAERITGGIGEGLLFGTPYEDVARLYGDNISQFELQDGARVLTEGSKEFAQITGRKRGPLLRNLRPGENLTGAANDAIEKARAAGYDAVEFNSMRDMGVAVLNPSIVRSAPTDPAIAQAEEVLDLIRAGRADEVTREMLDMGDDVLNARLNEHLWNNYDLPMDEASRMERARGFQGGLYSGTGDNFTAFSGQSWATDNPDLAYTYAPSVGGSVMPLMMRAKHGAPVINAGGANWNALTPSMREGGPQAPYLRGILTDPEDLAKYGEDLLTTQNFADAAKEQGFSGVTFNDVVDVGGYLSKYFPEGPQRDAQRASIARAGQPSKVEMRLYPNQVRSRFARFDPRLRHLDNLNAALAAGAPLGLLAMQPNEEY